MMTLIRWLAVGGAALAAFLATADSAAAQLFTPNSTTVQLPTFQMFTVDTTVMVPDSGAGLLGGASRSALGRSVYGPSVLAANSGLAGRFGAGGVSAHATIHDMAALDQAALELTGTGPAQAASPKLRKSSQLTPPGASVAEIRREQAALADARRAEVEKYVAAARQAEADGNPGVAKIYYKMALRRADLQTQREISTRLRALDAP